MACLAFRWALSGDSGWWRFVSALAGIVWTKVQVMNWKNYRWGMKVGKVMDRVDNGLAQMKEITDTERGSGRFEELQEALNHDFKKLREMAEEQR